MLGFTFITLWRKQYLHSRLRITRSAELNAGIWYPRGSIVNPISSRARTVRRSPYKYISHCSRSITALVRDKCHCHSVTESHQTLQPMQIAWKRTWYIYQHYRISWMMESRCANVDTSVRNFKKFANQALFDLIFFLSKKIYLCGLGTKCVKCITCIFQQTGLFHNSLYFPA